MKSNNYKDFIKSHPDFPKKGIIFRDVLPLLSKPTIFASLIENMSNNKFLKESDAIIGVDARGFIFGTALAIKLNKPLIVARKPGKLPGELTSFNYELEYGNNGLSMQKEIISEFNNFYIVDDLLATGGTVDCIRKIIEENSKIVVGLSVVIELKDLNARSKFKFPVNSVLQY